MKRKYLVQYAAVMTGLFLDVFSAGVLGWFSELEIVGIAFLATMLFIVGYAWTIAVMLILDNRDPKKKEAQRARRKKRSRAFLRNLKWRLPWPIRDKVMLVEWQHEKKTAKHPTTAPQIYTLIGGLEEIRSHDDRDMVQIVPVWTARRENV